MRGKVRELSRGFAIKRITPAYAGKRFADNRYIYIKIGSPPPMRGKAQNGSKRRRVYRITPAYAGKRRTTFQNFYLTWDHPRLCGEKCTKCKLVICTTGSPPPMRGKVPQFYFSQIVYRITPAYAGKRKKVQIVATLNGDHPRLCGEKFLRRCSTDKHLGSPPPMRGKVDKLVFTRFVTRITPAYAGKSTS